MLFYKLIDYLNDKGWFPYFIVTPLFYSIGNASEELYFANLKARRDNKKLIVLSPFLFTEFLGYKFCNKGLFELESEYTISKTHKFIEFVLRLLLTIFFIPTRGMAVVLRSKFQINLIEDYYFPRIGIRSLWMLPGVSDFEWTTSDKVLWKKEFSDPLRIFLGKKQKLLSLKKCKEFGIPEESKFVCIHVREGGFKNDFDRRPYRNADIFNYIPAIEELTARGYWVIRLGDSSMKRLPKMEKVIDYPFTPQKSSYMDMFLIQECDFYIGMHSGVLDTAFMFQKRILMVNMYNWTLGYPLKSCDRGILKHIFSKKKGRFLSVEEILNGSWKLQNTEGMLDDNFEMLENTKDEIRSAVVEFLDDSGIVNDLQKKANLARVRNTYVLFESSDCPPGENIKDLPLLEKYRYASRVKAASGFLCQGFLHKNWEINDRKTLNEVRH
ncbi:TIGR04372 family glycosyltransferase [Bacteriovoracales bacterium]|nr:TIGR04372 family glycosyltransferase [Bacteriovoracales bacterium]